MMTIVKPAGPIFFWAPAYINPYLSTSMGLDKRVLEASVMSGTPFVSGLK